MLTIHFGDTEDSLYGPTWFRYNYKTEWLRDPFVGAMIKGVDDSEYIDGLVINSPVLGPIPPERLSGGLKTLILVYERPDLVFDATSCGQNCAEWLIEIGKQRDVKVVLNYLMTFEKCAPFEIIVDNEGRRVSDPEDYLITAARYI